MLFRSMTHQAAAVEGTRISGSFSTALSIDDPSQPGFQRILRKDPFSATVRRGAGTAAFTTAAPTESTLRADAPAGFLVAVADSPEGVREQRFTFRDPIGRRHELLVRRSGQRVLSSRHYVNGELFVSIDNEWRRDNSLWIVDSVRATMDAEGRRVRADIAVDHTIRSGSLVGATGAAVVDLAGSGLGALAPQPAEAIELSCIAAHLQLAGTSGMLAISIVSGQWYAAVFTSFAYVGSITNLAGSCEG